MDRVLILATARNFLVEYLNNQNGFCIPTGKVLVDDILYQGFSKTGCPAQIPTPDSASPGTKIYFAMQCTNSPDSLPLSSQSVQPVTVTVINSFTQEPQTETLTKV